MRESWYVRWKHILEFDDSPAYCVEILKGIIRDAPEQGFAWRRLGILLRDLARYDEAEAALSRALELCNPEKRVFDLCYLGSLESKRGNFEAAESWFRRAIDETPDDAQGYIYLGGILAREGRLDEAEATHRRGTLCSEGCIDEAYLNLGLVLRGLGRYEDALRCFDIAIEMDPEYETALAAKRDVERAIELRGKYLD